MAEKKKKRKNIEELLDGLRNVRKRVEKTAHDFELDKKEYGPKKHRKDDKYGPRGYDKYGPKGYDKDGYGPKGYGKDGYGPRGYEKGPYARPRPYDEGPYEQPRPYDESRPYPEDDKNDESRPYPEDDKKTKPTKVPRVFFWGKNCWIPIIGMGVSALLTQMWFFFAFLFWLAECKTPDPEKILDKSIKRIEGTFDKVINRLETKKRRIVSKYTQAIHKATAKRHMRYRDSLVREMDARIRTLDNEIARIESRRHDRIGRLETKEYAESRERKQAGGYGMAKGIFRLGKLSFFSIAFLVLPIPFAKPVGLVAAFVGYFSARA